MNKEVKKALVLAGQLGVKVWNNPTVHSASWSSGMQIEVNLKKQRGAYPILHEMGHAFMGNMCCREHCEYAAHGFAFGLAKAFNIKLPKSMRKANDPYAGRTLMKREGCPMAMLNNKKSLALDKKELIEEFEEWYNENIHLRYPHIQKRRIKAYLLNKIQNI